jgi:hypothetical protein
VAGRMGGEPPVDPQLELDDAVKNLDRAEWPDRQQIVEKAVTNAKHGAAEQSLRLAGRALLHARYRIRSRSSLP